MKVFIFILVAIGAWLIGVFGWAQIIGSIQNFKSRGAKMIVPILVWLAILGASLFVVLKFLPTRIWAWVIGMAVSLVQVLLRGRIE